MKLAHYTQGRDNNFNLVRILAAFAVLVSHSYPLALGPLMGRTEPFRNRLDMTLGSIAVDLFFVASGFLVTASLLNRKSVVEFLWARLLRIFPALWVMVLLIVFGLGLHFTTLPRSDFLADPQTHTYLLQNSTLFSGLTETKLLQRLPGVFADNPLPLIVNGSMWSLPYEVRMYLSLVALWTVARLAKGRRFRMFEYALVSIAVVAGVWKLFGHTAADSIWAGEGRTARLIFAFYSGAALFVLREHIVLSRPVFWALLIALPVSTIDAHAFFIVYSLAVPYLLLYLAYVPAGFIRHYNRVGDYSYGVYIYAFPVQQSVAALIPHVPVLTMFLVSATVTLTLAVLSWHLLEKHALGLKNFYVDHTRRLLGASPADARSTE